MGRQHYWSWVELLQMEELLAGFREVRGISLLAICRDSRTYSVSLLSQRKGGVAIRAYRGFGQPGNDFGQVPFFNQARDGNDQVEFTTVRIQKRAPQLMNCILERNMDLLNLHQQEEVPWVLTVP